MKTKDIKQAISRVRFSLKRLDEVKGIIWKDNADVIMRGAICQSIFELRIVGKRLADCVTNGPFLYPEFFNHEEGVTMVSPSSVLGLDAASAPFQPIAPMRQGFGRASFDNTPDHKTASTGERAELLEDVD